MAVLLMPMLAAAQEGGTDKGGQLEEIVVTAQRREEGAQKVPISMTVMDAASLAKLSSTNDIGQVVPNVQIEQTTGFGIPRLAIRGIAQGDLNANATTANMVYFDDMPMNSAISQGIPIWDLGRAEVLRGPQGTLFGRNATGGAIRYISTMPGDHASGYADVTLGRFGQNEIHAAYGGPVTDTLGVRLSYIGNRTGGDVYNVTLNERQGKKAYYGVRGIVEWKPADALTVVLRAQYFKSDLQPLLWKTTPGIATGDGFGPLPDGRTVADIQTAYGFQNLGYSSNYTKSENNMRPNEHLEHLPVSLNVEWDFGPATLTWVGGYLRVNHSFRIDNDATPAPILDEYDQHKDRQWTQELRLASNNDGPFNWIAGGFYIKEKMRTDLHLDATEWRANAIFPDAHTDFYTRGARQKMESWAAFLHTTYQFTPELTLTAAARYTWEKKDMTYIFRSEWDFPTNVPHTSEQFMDFIKAIDSGNWGTELAAAEPPVSGSKSWKNLSWKIALDYQLNPHTLLYALVSRGFKGGAYQPNVNLSSQVVNPDGTLLSVKPETVTDYEAGVKADLIPGRLRVNGSAFYYDYRNYQTNQFVSVTNSQVLSSMPKARVVGVELEMDAVPVDNLFFNLGMGITDAKIVKSLDPALEGNKLPYAENFNLNASLRYKIDLDFGSIS
ncbi:MAG: TonB-dependent receptor, partial [Sphingobium sp.]